MMEEEMKESCHMLFCFCTKIPMNAVINGKIMFFPFPLSRSHYELSPIAVPDKLQQ